MNDENKTIGDLLKSIDDKAVDRAEVLPLLKGLERNTAGNTGKVIGTAITKAIATKQAGKSTDSTSPSTATAVATSATIPSKNASNAVPSTTTPATSVRDSAGKFHGKDSTSETAPGASDPKDIGMTGALKNLFNKHKDGLKDTAGRMALGPLYDVGVEMKDSAKEARERAGDKSTVTGQVVKKTKGLFGFGKDKAQATHDKAQAKHDKVEAASDKAEAKHDQLQAKADKAKQGAKAGMAAGSTVVNNNDSGGGLLDTASHLLPMLPKKVTGFLSKIPLLGKLFPAAAGAGTVAAEAGGAVAGGAAKAAGGGLLKAVGGKIPLIGGLISGGITLAQGGSASEAVGSGTGATVGAMAGGAIGSVIPGAGTAVGAILGGIAGEWIGKKLGTTFDKQNRSQDDLARADEALQQQGAQQQQGFLASIGSMFSSLPDKLGALKDKTVDAVSGGYQSYKESRAKGGSFFGSLGDAVGSVAKRFESGKGGAGTISSGEGDFGGKSYGSFQLSSKQGSVDKFLNKSGYAQQFQGLQVGSKDFDAKWKETAKNDPNFEKAQTNFAKEKYATPQLAKLQGMGVDTNNRAIQEMAMSTGVQYGEGTNVLESALKGKNTAAMTPADIVNAVQDYKASSVGTRFKNSSGSVQQGVAKRHDGEERQALLSLTGQTVTADGKPVSTAPAAYTAKPGTKEFNDMQAKFVADQQGTAPAVGVAIKKSNAALPVVAAKKQVPKPVEGITPDDKTVAEAKPAVAEPAAAVGIPERRAKKSSEIRAEREAASVASTPVLPAAAVGVVTKKVEPPPTAPDSPVTVAKAVPATTAIVPEVAAPPSEGNPVKTADATPALPVAVTPEASTAVPASVPATAVQVATATQPLNATLPSAPVPAAATGTAQPAKKKTGFFDSLTNAATGFASGFAPKLAKSVSLSDPTATVAGKVQTPVTGTATGATVQAQPETVRLAKRSSQGVQTLSPLPQPQVAQVPLPPPVEVPGLERLAKSQEQQAVKKPDVVASAGLPHIKTEFDDTMLVLMSYDRI